MLYKTKIILILILLLLISSISGNYIFNEKKEIEKYELRIKDFPGDPYSYEMLAYIYKGLGKYNKANEYFISAITNGKQRRENYILLNFIKRISSYITDTDIEAFYKKVFESGEYPNEIRDYAGYLLMNYYFYRGDFINYKGVLKKLNYIKSMRIIYGFDNTGGVGIDDINEVEKKIDFKKEYQAKYWAVSWRELHCKYPFIDLMELCRPDKNNIAFIYTGFNVQSDDIYEFSISSSAEFKLLLDGKRIFAIKQRNSISFDQYRFRIPLKEGQHYILLKTGITDDKQWKVAIRGVSPGITFNLLDMDKSKIIENEEKNLFNKITFPAIYEYLASQQQLDNWENFYFGFYRFILKDFDKKELKALFYFKKALGNDSKLPWFLYYRALADDNKNVRKFNFIKATKMWDNYIEAYYKIGQIYYNLNFYDTALEYFNMSLSRQNFAPAQIFKSSIFIKYGWYMDALSILDKVKDNGQLSYKYILRSKIIDSLRPHEEYITYLEKRYSQSKDKKITKLLLKEYYERENIEKAVELFKDMTSFEPYNSNLYYDLAELYFKIGDIEQAISIMKKGLELLPENLKINERIAEYYNFIGKSDLRDTYFEKSLILKPNNQWVLNYKNDLQETTERFYDKYDLSAEEFVSSSYEAFIYKDYSSVLLLDQSVEKVYENGTASTMVHTIYKILSDDGIKKHAVKYIYYTPSLENISIIHARVFNAGAIYEATRIKDVSVSDPDARLYYDYKRKEIYMPNLSTDSIVDLHYRIDYTGKNLFSNSFNSSFYFAGRNPLQHSQYILICPEKMNLNYYMVNTTNKPVINIENNNRVYKWDFYNMEGFLSEPKMVPYTEFIPYTVISSFKDWDEVGKFIAGLIKGQDELNDELLEVVEDIRKKSKNSIDRLKNAYYFVTDNIRYVGLEFGIGGYKPRKSSIVYRTGYGDCKDTALLMASLINKLGFKAWVALIRTKDHGEVNINAPTLKSFNHAIVYVDYKGGLFLDGTASFNGFNELPYSNQGVNAFIPDSKDSFFKRIPIDDSRKNVNIIETDVFLNENGPAVLKRKLTKTGQFAPSLRYVYLEKENRKKTLADYWNRIYAGSEIMDIDFSNLSNRDKSVSYSYRVKVPLFSNKTLYQGNEQIRFRAKLSSLNMVKNYASSTERKFDIVLDYPWQSRVKVIYHIPEDYSVISIPDNVLWNIDFAEYRSTYNVFSDKHIIVLDYALAIIKTRIPVSMYKEFRNFCKNIDKYENLEIVLQKIKKNK